MTKGVKEMEKERKKKTLAHKTLNFHHRETTTTTTTTTKNQEFKCPHLKEKQLTHSITHIKSEQ